MIASIVDTDALLTVVWASLLAGIGVTAAYGLAILGGVRAIELGRSGRAGEAAIFAAGGCGRRGHDDRRDRVRNHRRSRLRDSGQLDQAV